MNEDLQNGKCKKERNTNQGEESKFYVEERKHLKKGKLISEE